MSQPQCNAITNTGKRCSRRKDRNHSAYCAQHANQGLTQTIAQAKEDEKSLPPSKVAADAPPTSQPVAISSVTAINERGGQHRTPSPADTEPKTTNEKFLAKFASRPVDDAPHLIVEARAGTGKTTTLIEGLKRLKGFPTEDFVPSPQQQAVFDCIELSRDKVSSICFVAFNKSIASELQARVPQGCEASTMHSMGFRAVKNAIRLNNNGAVNDDRVSEIICEIVGCDIREMRRKDMMLLNCTKKLVSLVKANLSETDEESLDRLVSHYGIEFTKEEDPYLEEKTREKCFALVPQVIERCKDVSKDGYIDYDDMIYIPIALGLQVPRFDLLLIDERQDLNRCQMALALKMGKRIIAVGDENQSIYGFAGADAQACKTFKQLLVETGRAVTELPLTVTRRCCKAVVREAQKYVPDFQAHESNPEGLVRYARLQ